MDSLLVQESDPQNQPQITPEGTQPDPHRQAGGETRARGTAERSQARAFAAQLRVRKAQMGSQTQAVTEESAGPAKRILATQRTNLFEKWGSKLEAAVADDSPNRAQLLRELQRQLRATRGELTDAPLVHGTPTLQAMPAGFVPPKNNGPVAGESRNP